MRTLVFKCAVTATQLLLSCYVSLAFAQSPEVISGYGRLTDKPLKESSSQRRNSVAFQEPASGNLHTRAELKFQNETRLEAFRVADLNGDGKLSSDELTQYKRLLKPKRIKKRR